MTWIDLTVSSRWTNISSLFI